MRLSGAGFRVLGVHCGVRALMFSAVSVKGVECGVQGLGLRVRGLGYEVQVPWFRI